MSFARELNGLSIEDLIERFEARPRAWDGSAVLYYDEVADRLIAAGSEGRAAVLAHLDDSFLPRQQAAVAALAVAPGVEDALLDKIVELLESPTPELVMTAIDALRHLGQTGFVDRVVAKKEHPSPLVRAAILRYLAEVEPSRAATIALERLDDPEQIVRQQAADVLGDLRVGSASERLERLVDDPHPHVRQAAATALERLHESSADGTDDRETAM